MVNLRKTFAAAGAIAFVLSCSTCALFAQSSSHAQTLGNTEMAPEDEQVARLRMPAEVDAAALPNAPEPAATAEPAPLLDGPESAPRNYTLFLSSSASKYTTVVRPGEKRAPFTVREKFIFAARETVSPEQFFTVPFGAGYSQLLNGNPKFGTNSAGYGERVGVAAFREASDHFLSDAVYASTFRQDPRYFRDGPMVPFKTRVRHLLISVVTSHADSDGRLEPDYSGLLGRASTAYLTEYIYPHVSANNRVAAETFGYSILGELGGNIFLEFWPDVIHPHSRRKNIESQQ